MARRIAPVRLMSSDAFETFGEVELVGAQVDAGAIDERGDGAGDFGEGENGVVAADIELREGDAADGLGGSHFGFGRAGGADAGARLGKGRRNAEADARRAADRRRRILPA